MVIWSVGIGENVCARCKHIDSRWFDSGYQLTGNCERFAPSAWSIGRRAFCGRDCWHRWCQSREMVRGDPKQIHRTAEEHSHSHPTHYRLIRKYFHVANPNFRNAIPHIVVPIVHQHQTHCAYTRSYTFRGDDWSPMAILGFLHIKGFKYRFTWLLS